MDRFHGFRFLSLLALVSAYALRGTPCHAEALKHKVSPTSAQSASASAAPAAKNAGKDSAPEMNPLIMGEDAILASKNLVSKEQAKHFAQQHLALQNYSWGKPLAMTDNEDAYLFAYETPLIEKRLIGQRVITVSKKTGLTRVKDRR